MNLNFKLKDTRILFFILAAIAIVSRTWVTEDAYITFRHIDNFFAGNGLVFNKGERVEGFTHPVWAILILVFHSAGIPNHIASVILGYLFSLGGIYLLLKYAGKAALLLSVAVLVANQGFVDFSTAGMETSLTFFLLCHLFYELVPANMKSPAKVSLILSLLYLNRPEFGLLLFYYFIYSLYLSWKQNKLKRAIQFAVPALLIAGSYHLFRWSYYHDIFPNTYYAKSGGAANYVQGLKYLLHFTIYSWLFLPYLGLWTYTFIKKSNVRRSELRYVGRDLGAVFLMVFYITRVGGDFMAFRLLLPSFYLFVMISNYYMQKWWLHELPARKIFRYNVALLVLVALATGTRLAGVEVPLAKLGTVNERLAYTMDDHPDLFTRMTGIQYKWYREGEKTGQLQKCLGYDKFVITNSVTEAKCTNGIGLGYFAVAAGTDIVLIDELGLTDKRIASQKRIEKFRVGHERSVGLEYLIEKGTLFCSLDSPAYDSLMATDFGVVINLDPEFLYRLGPDTYRQKISGLKKLYLQNQHAATEEGQRIFSRLQELERRYSVKIMELPPVAPAGYEKYEKCWKNRDNET